ncbi:MAG TPA: iron-sulfur cluster insertion protein ErpA [Anaerolineales bacterium]|nr:iron-sulfur cluster insertion protein ErpA [Anaerolineales bacterium]
MEIADKVETPTTETAVETPSVELSPAAVDRVRRLLEERQLADHALRVFISGGGCSGLQYGMALEGQPRDTDHHFDFDGVGVVVDPMSMEYLAGARIDYIDDVMGGGFKIENPNAVSSCGCGHSFRTSREGAGASGAGCGCH